MQAYHVTLNFSTELFVGRRSLDCGVLFSAIGQRQSSARRSTNMFYVSAFSVRRVLPVFASFRSRTWARSLHASYRSEENLIRYDEKVHGDRQWQRLKIFIVSTYTRRVAKRSNAFQDFVLSDSFYCAFHSSSFYFFSSFFYFSIFFSSSSYFIISAFVDAF